MTNNMKTFLPAAGTASRLSGIPKFYLPIKNDESLISYHLKNISKFENNSLEVGVSKQFYESLAATFPEVNIKEIKSNSMVETVYKLGLPEDKISLVVMPDTYFSEYKRIDLMRQKLISNNYDIMLGLWTIRNDQKGKLGQCRVVGDLVTNIIDKNKDCNENFFWGLIMWNPKFNSFIRKEDSHFGESLNRAIKNNLKVGYQEFESDYFDCGTFTEYKFLIKNI